MSPSPNQFVPVKNKAVVKKERKVAATVSKLTVDDGQPGPTIPVFMGNILLCDSVPKQALIAASWKAKNFLTESPLSKEVRLPADCANQGILVRVLKRLSYPGFWVPTPQDYVDQLTTYQAADALGVYTKALARSIRNTISGDVVWLEHLTAFVERIPVTDPLYEHFMHNLTRCRYNEVFTNMERFNEWLEFYPALEDAMDEVDEKYVRARKEARQAATAKQKQAGKGKKEKNKQKN